MKKADLENSKAIASASLGTWGAKLEVVYIDNELNRVYYRTIIGDVVSCIHFSTIRTLHSGYTEELGFVTYRGDRVLLSNCIRFDSMWGDM